MKTLFYLLTPIMLFCGLIYPMDNNNMDNPFFKEWKTPFQTPPFNEIKLDHYLPSFEEGIKQQKAAIDAIINSAEKPTFENTITALEKSDKFLERVNNVFSNLNSANTNTEMQNIARTVTPLLTKNRDDINLNPGLFQRVKQIYNNLDNLDLTVEQKTVLENYYLNFVRGGANLTEQEKDKLRKINEELSMLSLKFGENLLKETNTIGLIVDNKDDLAGLPDGRPRESLQRERERDRRRVSAGP